MGSRSCGTCTKCVRTKLNLLAATGAIPDIFADRSDLPALIDALPIPTRRSELAAGLAFSLDIPADRLPQAVADALSRHITALRAAMFGRHCAGKGF